jgi:hypothetical protein
MEGVTNTMLGGPIGLYDHYGPRRIAGARNALREAQEGALDIRAANERASATAGSHAARRRLRHDAATLGLGSEYERAVAGANFEASEAGSAFVEGRRERTHARDAAFGRERQRLDMELDRFVVAGREDVLAAKDLARAKVADADRDVARRRRTVVSQVPGLMAAAEGNFGLAGERDFAAGLNEDEAAARAYSPLLGAAVRGVNRLKAGARAAAIRFDRAGLRSQTRVQSAMSMFDDEGVIREEADYARGAARVTGRDAGEVQDLIGRADATERNQLRRHRLDRMAETDALMLRRDVSGILADPSRSMATAGNLARVRDIFGSARNEADVYGAMGRHAQADLAREAGINDLAGMKRQLMAAVGGQEVSVNRFAAGSEDVLSVLREIEKNTRELRAQTTGAKAQ